MSPKIIKVVSTESNVQITLENNVVIDLNSNDGYLHLHLSGILAGVTAAASLNIPGLPTLKMSNYLDVGYKPYEERK